MSEGTARQSADIEGGMRFGIDARLTAKELREWPADRIKMFFDGLDMALRALRGDQWSDEWSDKRAAAKGGEG